MAGRTLPNFRLRWRLAFYWSYVVLALLAVPKVLSLLVPRDPSLVVVGAGLDHVDNAIGILSARPGPPKGTVVRVLAAPRHRADPRLLAAVAAIPHAKVLRRRSPAALWACLRAGWVLVPNKRPDAWRFWLGRARIAYINHGPWMKRMDPAGGRDWHARLYDFLYGRYELVLASTPAEIPDYRAWLGSHVQVVCLGYPRSPVLDEQRRPGLAPHKVGLWPTWKEFDDPTFGHAMAHRLHAVLLTAGFADACVDYRPHHMSPDGPLVLGKDDGRYPTLVVTDFSSVAFDQFYRGGKVLLHSTILDRYLERRGVRSVLEPWLRREMVLDEAALHRRAVSVLRGQDPGTPDPLGLQPFDSAAFWRCLFPRSPSQATGSGTRRTHRSRKRPRPGVPHPR